MWMPTESCPWPSHRLPTRPSRVGAARGRPRCAGARRRPCEDWPLRYRKTPSLGLCGPWENVCFNEETPWKFSCLASLGKSVHSNARLGNRERERERGTERVRETSGRSFITQESCFFKMKLTLHQIHSPVTLRVCLSQPPYILITNIRIWHNYWNNGDFSSALGTKFPSVWAVLCFEKGRYYTWGRHRLSVHCVCTWEFMGKFSKVDHSLWNNTQITCSYDRSSLYGTYGTLSLMFMRFTAWILLYYWDLTLILWWWEGAVLLLWNLSSLFLLLLHLLGGWEQLIILSCHLLSLWGGK